MEGCVEVGDVSLCMRVRVVGGRLVEEEEVGRWNLELKKFFCVRSATSVRQGGACNKQHALIYVYIVYNNSTQYYYYYTYIHIIHDRMTASAYNILSHSYSMVNSTDFSGCIYSTKRN